ncbi:pitrilysin family protein [Roseofilum sp. BLCC_M91]|uniref:Pitrilysin family protein n=1 Tax=Roseofilum halophilum BLCC-M91 TaxID=3022259 RepID=A0ABT7BI71_9CYAN|nr:pitrilysin family protein [Roseofilum halophilum]MDJ1178888.1 pitrilysin family protein [Roseofilum halophilum BLCC-M91]
MKNIWSIDPGNLKKLGVILLSVFLSIYVLGVQPAIALIQDSSEFSIQPYLDKVEKQVKTFTLENGIKFIVLERHQAPVVSFMLYADVGGANEPVGETGVAHYLEHLAFKGTTDIGTTDYEAEKPLMDELDRLFDRIQAAKANGNTEKAQDLQAEFTRINQKASQYIKQNEFGQIVERFGGVGLNATTSTDATRYFFSLPSNKLELWMSLESDRFLDPVFREFYQEKDVILEERRMRTDNSPIGKMIEAFQDAAFKVHPYRQPVIGYEEDLRNLRRQDVRDFFETYYVPNNLIVAIVGDINTSEVKKLAQTYFGRFPARPTPKVNLPVEPPQTETREVTLELPTQPMYLEGYHRPAGSHPDHAVYDLMGAILSDGRTARLYKSLVEEKQVSLSAAGFSGFPGDKYPNLMLFYSLTAPGSTVDRVAEALGMEIERLKTEPVSQEELDRVKTQAKASLLGTLDSNSGLASLLAEYEAKSGSWRNLFQEIEAIEAVTPEAIQRVAKTTFTPENRTIGRLLTASN